MWPCYKQTKFDGQIKKARFCAKHRETVHIHLVVTRITFSLSMRF